MTVAELIAALQQYPLDADVDITVDGATTYMPMAVESDRFGVTITAMPERKP
jgi:hypothetical protein